MAGDPPLNQVVTKTWESGIRGQHNSVSWNAGVFRAANRDDILFVTSGQTGFGFFKNFGETLRRGAEFGANGQLGRVTLGTGYTFLDATFQSEETVNGEGNSANDAALTGAKGLEGTIQIEPGDRMPLIPRHMLKAFAEVQATSKLSVNIDLVAVSSSYARGDGQPSRHQPDGTYYLGQERHPAYAVVNLGGTFGETLAADARTRSTICSTAATYTAGQPGPLGLTIPGVHRTAASGDRWRGFPVRHGTFYAPGLPSG
jgi:hypothetical protein